MNELIRYEEPIDSEIIHQPNLNDLNGTFDDMGQLIAYMRDLVRDVNPLVKSLVPLSDNLNDFIENYQKKMETFFEDNPLIAIGGIVSVALVGGYLTTGIIKNILEIKNSKK